MKRRPCVDAMFACLTSSALRITSMFMVPHSDVPWMLQPSFVSWATRAERLRTQPFDAVVDPPPHPGRDDAACGVQCASRRRHTLASDAFRYRRVSCRGVLICKAALNHKLDPVRASLQRPACRSQEVADTEFRHAPDTECLRWQPSHAALLRQRDYKRARGWGRYLVEDRVGAVISAAIRQGVFSLAEFNVDASKPPSALILVGE